MSTSIARRGDGDIEAGNFTRYVSDTETKISPAEAPLQKMTDGRNNGNVVDTEKWASSLESMLEEVPHYMCMPGYPGRISKIPENLRQVDIKAYEPCYLSIGPYHHGKLSLQRMETTKLIILKYFLEHNPQLILKDILKEIKGIEPAARSFYTDVEMESEKFVKLLLLDSLYLVVMFCGVTKNQEGANHEDIIYWSSMDNEDENDVMNQINESISSNSEREDREILKMADQSKREISREDNMNGPKWLWTFLAHDLFLLENQLPFFVLQKMHDVVYGGSQTQLIVNIQSMFHHLLLDYGNINSKMAISQTEEVHHLLHLCHMFFRPTFQQYCPSQLPESSQMFRLGSAVQLHEAGVSFEAKLCSTPYSLLDITFSRSGKITMPRLHVDDNTNSLLRNLIALEQMKYPNMGLNVSAYAVLMLHLVTVPADVELLRRKGIIQHHLASDKELMHLINRLSVGLAFDYQEDKYNLKPVFQELKRYSNNRVPRWRAWIKHKYFSNPWTAISLIAASLLLLLTALQTFYAVYSYYYPTF